jgi:signal transduction histidine kinase
LTAFSSHPRDHPVRAVPDAWDRPGHSREANERKIALTQAVLPVRTALGEEAARSAKRVALHASQLALLAAAYYLAARLGVAFRFQSSPIGVVWPPSAILVSALLLTPRARWWTVLGTASLAHVAAMYPVVPVWRWEWQIVNQGVFTALTAALLQRVPGLPLRFGSRRQVFAFTAIVFVMSGLSAFTTPVFVRSLFGFDVTYSPPAALLRAMLSNATAIFVIVPVILLWAQRGFRRVNELPRRRVVEATLIMTSLLAVGTIAFGTGPEIARFPSLLLWIFPPLVYAAVRLGPTGAATSLFCIAALSIWGTAEQLGPFVLIAEADQVLSLHMFWIVIGPPILLLAALIRERELAEHALHEQRHQLAHVTRVAAVGEMSGALAHELHQPLTSILANAQAAILLLDRHPADLREVRAILEDIAQQDNHAASVIARFRSFLKEGESRFEPLVVESVVRDALALSRSSVTLSGVDVQTQISAGLPRVWGDPVQLLQVMVNLVVNGCEAMSLTPQADRRLRLQAASIGHEHVQLSVADCGVGLPRGGEDDVFEPFFTTKPKGLGLGLAIGRSIVTAHGGRLWGENNPSQGATFHLLLPTERVRGGVGVGVRTAHSQW